jgi:hypothetical protein
MESFHCRQAGQVACRLAGFSSDPAPSDELTGVMSVATAPLQRTRTWQLGCCRSLMERAVRQRGSLIAFVTANQ